MSDSKWSQVEPVTSQVKDICMQVEPDIQQMCGVVFEVYNPISFASQDVSGGTKYVVKVSVGRDCVHAMINAVRSDTDHSLIVEDTQYPKTLSDPLIPF